MNRPHPSLFAVLRAARDAEEMRVERNGPDERVSITLSADASDADLARAERVARAMVWGFVAVRVARA